MKRFSVIGAIASILPALCGAQGAPERSRVSTSSPWPVLMCRSTVPAAGTDDGGSSASTVRPLPSALHSQVTVLPEPLPEPLPVPPSGALPPVAEGAPDGDAVPWTVVVQPASASASAVSPSAARALTSPRSSR